MPPASPEPTLSPSASRRSDLVCPARTLSVLLVSEPGIDGVFRHVESLANFLMDAGVRVSLAYSHVRGGPALDRLVKDVAQRGGRTLDLGVGNAPGPRDAAALTRLAALARALRPDAVHAHSSKAGALARVLPLAGVRARFFYTPHAYYQMHEPAGRGGLKHRVFETVERLLARVGTTINTSGTEATHARNRLGLAPDRQVTILNGVDVKCFRPALSPAERRGLRGELGLPADALLLGTVARLSPQKDPLTLYRALLPVLAARPELHFAHLNAVGELAAEVELLLRTVSPGVRERIYRRPASGKPECFYRALDAFILPSRYEGLSFAALEAAASGLPLILTDCPGNADLRSHPFDHLRWAPPGDARRLQEEILAWAVAAANAAPDLPIFCNHHRVTSMEFGLDRQFQALLRLYRGKT